MDAYIAVLSALLLALAYYYLSRPVVKALKVTTRVVKPEEQLLETPPAFTPKERHRNVAKSPKAKTKLVSLPPPNPTLHSSISFPPFYRKPIIPSISHEQREQIYHSVHTKLSVHIDPEETCSSQQLLQKSFFSAVMNADDFDPGITGQYRAGFGKILEKMQKIAEASAKKWESENKAQAAVPVAVSAPVVTAPKAAPLVPPTPVPQGASAAAAAGSTVEQIAKEIQETKALKENQPALPNDLNGDLNEIIGQITSDLDDVQHLSRCAQRCVGAIKQKAKSEQAALLSLCEKVLTQCRINVENIKNGTAFALTYVAFVVEVSQTFPALQRYFRDLLLLRRTILIPTVITDQKQIEERLQILDMNPDALEGAMNLTRAYGAMRAALNADPGSQYGMRDGWNWLARVLNIPTGQIDRTTIPTLTGYLKVLKMRGTLKQYGTQGRKLAAILQSEYKPVIRDRFWGVNKLYHTFVSMLEEAISEINADFT